MSARTAAVLGRRTCAVLAATSAVLHAVMLGHAANPATGSLMAVMAGGCLYCARDLWLRGSLQVWCVVALMNLAMIALHTPAPSHHHQKVADAAAQPSTIMALASLLAAVEVAAAGTVMYYRTRHRVVGTRGQSQIQS